MKCCGNCYYWVDGECHKEPPILLPKNSLADDRHFGWKIGWPTTKHSDWCGEYTSET